MSHLSVSYSEISSFGNLPEVEMVVATNAFLRLAPRPPSAGVDLVRLGERMDETTDIILVLGKDWGAGAINSIERLTATIESYPKDVRCFLFGAETTIPTTEFSKYPHGGRDAALRRLCAEILRRSNSIGVRGDITYQYLVNHLGIDREKVQIIFQKDDPANDERMKSFIASNKFPHSGLGRKLLGLQSNPGGFTYVPGASPQAAITIGKPYLTSTPGKARLNADVTIDGSTARLWCECDEEYGDFLTHEVSDAFLFVLLPFAMRTGKDLVCEGPVSDRLIHNLQEIVIPQLSKHDPRLYPSKIEAVAFNGQLGSHDAVATGMSCGIDSFYSALSYSRTSNPSLKLTHLYVGNYLYGNGGIIHERARQVSVEMGLPLISTATNINEALRLPHVPTHFYKTLFGVLSLKKLFGTYLYSSAGSDLGSFTLTDNATIDTAKYELFLMYALADKNFQVTTAGVKLDRLEKTRALIDFEPAQRHLNVCLKPMLATNCGECGKCVRTLVALDALGALDRFRDVFPIDDYLSRRSEHFVWVVRGRDNVFFSAVYDHFSETEPELIAAAQRALTRAQAD